MNAYVQRLDREGLNLIILKANHTLFTSHREGMRPLLDAIHSCGRDQLANSIVIDKIVGKAAALLISYFQAKAVHCGVLSEPARKALDQHGIEYFYQQLLPTIMNKSGTDICPFEKTVLEVDDPSDGYNLLLTKLQSR
jgi:hypothetical protein